MTERERFEAWMRERYPDGGFTCPNCKHHTWWTDELTATSPPEHTEQEPVCNIEVTDGRLSSIDWLYTFRGNATARLALDDGKHALYARPVPETGAGAMTEREPDPALIDSMALRYRHDFGLLDEQTKNSIRTTMRQLWEEVVGLGFYKGAALAQRTESAPIQSIYDAVDALAQRTEQEPVALPSFIRQPIERAIEDALNPPPGSMTLGDGKARIGSDKLAYVLRLFDRGLYARPVLDDEGMRLLREAKDRIVGWCTRFDLMPDASAEILAAIDAYLAKLKPISSHRD